MVLKSFQLRNVKDIYFLNIFVHFLRKHFIHRTGEGTDKRWRRKKARIALRDAIHR